MVFYLMLCRSLTYAQRSVHALEKAGVPGYILRTPKQLTTDGCGYCVKVSEQKFDRAMNILRQNGLPPKKVYLQHDNGQFSEVEL